MKRDLRICILILTPFFLALLILTYFVRWAPPKADGAVEQEIPGYEGLSLSVREDSVSSGGINVEILNESGEEIALESSSFQIHVKKGEQWLAVKFTKELSLNGISRPAECPAGEVVAESYKWDSYGNLSSGDYRIVLSFYKRTTGESFDSAAEFTIA